MNVHSMFQFVESTVVKRALVLNSELALRTVENIMMISFADLVPYE